jgi:hypothetical protein
VEEIAKKKGVSMSQIAVAWVMSKDPVAAPIIGATKMDHLKDLLSTFFAILFTRPNDLCLTDAVNVSLEPDEIKYLEELYVSRGIAGFS